MKKILFKKWIKKFNLNNKIKLKEKEDNTPWENIGPRMVDNLPEFNVGKLNIDDKEEEKKQRKERKEEENKKKRERDEKALLELIGSNKMEEDEEKIEL